MKKFIKQKSLPCKFYKYLKLINLNILFAFLSIGIVSAASGYSQNTKLTLNVNNKTLKEVFNDIEKQSEYIFLYNDNAVNLNKRVNISVESVTINEILDKIIDKDNAEYNIVDRQVILYKNSRISNNNILKNNESQQSTIRITGSVKDSNGEPLIGVSVIVVGSNTGIITDLDGNYTINVNNRNAELSFSYVGYNNHREKVGNRTVINVTMTEDAALIDEVVVVGYGVQKKVNLTGSIATIDAKSLENRPMSNVSSGLAGLLPGVTVTQSSGMPGHDTGKIRIRGTGTLNEASPMVLVDGVEATMDNIDPNDVESITVLKDAASAAIYGSKASNGVILVTTKRGKTGKAVINYSANIGWQNPTRLPQYMGSAEYAELYNEALLNDNPRSTPQWTQEQINIFRDGSDPYEYPNTDWQDLLYKGSGFQMTHNVSATGGSDNVKYMTSIGYFRQDGVIRNTSKEQYNVRSNLDIKATDRLDISVNLSYTRMDLEEPTNSYVGGGVDQIFRQTNLISPWVPYKRENGDYGYIADGNPIAWMDLNQTINRKRNYFLGIGSLNYKVLDGLSLKGVVSYKTYSEDKNEFIKDLVYNPAQTAINAAARKYHGPNKMTQTDTFQETVSSDIYANYNKTFAEKHNLGIMGGFHSEYFQKKETKAYRQDFPSNELGDINGGSVAGQKGEGFTRELAMLSWFGRATYDYEGKYLLEANFRYDGSSRFADGNRWGFFPSFSAGWRISEESFMEAARNTLHNLKIRASWGKLGNQQALDDYYPTVSALSIGAEYSYPIGGSISSGAWSRYAKNPYLKWESSRSWNFGLDIGLFNNFSLTVDYYDRLTSDILMKIPTPDTYALEDFWDNVGEVSNRGIEIELQYNKKFDQVLFTFGGNFSYNKNEIKKLGDQYEFIDSKDDKLIRRVGSPINSLYGYKTAGLFQSQAEIDAWAKNGVKGTWRPGDLKYVDVDKNETVNAADRVIIGNVDPKILFGFNLGAVYRDFDFSAFFQGTSGGNGYMDSEAIGELNGFNGKPTDYWRDRWTPQNTGTDVPRVSALGKNGPSMASVRSAYWVQNSSYLRLKNLQIGYTLPTKVVQKLQLNRVRIYYSAQNLFTITNFVKGWDPEAPADRGSHYPQVKVNSFGINVTF